MPSTVEPAMIVLDDEAGVKTQLLMWGYALTREMCETTALISEGHSELVHGGAWDGTAADLATKLVAYGDEPYHHPPEWWVLPAVCDLVMRGLDAPNVQLLKPLGTVQGGNHVA